MSWHLSQIVAGHVVVVVQAKAARALLAHNQIKTRILKDLYIKFSPELLLIWKDSISMQKTLKTVKMTKHVAATLPRPCFLMGGGESNI